MKYCIECKKVIFSYGDMCPECKAKDRETDMAVGDKGGM